MAQTGQLELKICDRCGGLWLRPVGTSWMNCATCVKTIEKLRKLASK